MYLRMQPYVVTCDCYQCEHEHREEVPMQTTHLTCTCGSRYVRDAEHEGDCDLWLIDEFWAGFLAWDWDREILYPTNRSSEVEWIDDYLTQKNNAYGVESMSNAQLGMTDEDIALTTDAFIDRMIAARPEDAADTWVKGPNGMWGKTEKRDDGSTVTTYKGSPHLPGGDYDWTNWAGTDRHTQTPITFPDGTRVYGTSLIRANERAWTPDFALYLDDGWKAEGMAIMIPWRDYGLPEVSFGMAVYAIKEAFAWAKAGAKVEVGCIGAHGRTGVVFACMALHADPTLTAVEAVRYVREVYCEHAIETKEQEWYIACFEAEEKGTPHPPRPAYVAPTPTVVTAGPKAKGMAQSHSGGPLGDPARKSGRRSRRGGKRNRARQGVSR